MPETATIVTVCTANICRSPMAAALLQHALAAQPEPLRSIKVISAGVSAHPGEPVSPNSVTALKKVGLDLSSHRSRPLDQQLLNEAALILCMTESHRMVIQRQGNPPPKHLFLYREFMADPGNLEIPDPYGGPLKVYEAARDEMVEAVPSIVEYLKTRFASRSA